MLITPALLFWKVLNPNVLVYTYLCIQYRYSFREMVLDFSWFFLSLGLLKGHEAAISGSQTLFLEIKFSYSRLLEWVW